MPNQREFLRKERINKILEILKLCEEENREIDTNKFLYQIMFEFGIARRTAREYIETAKSQCQIKTISKEETKSINL